MRDLINYHLLKKNLLKSDDSLRVYQQQFLEVKTNVLGYKKSAPQYDEVVNKLVLQIIHN